MESPAGPTGLAGRLVSNATPGFGAISGGVGLPSIDGGVSGTLLLAPLGSWWALVGDGGVGCWGCARVGNSKLKRPWLPVPLVSTVAVLWGSSDGQGRASMTAAVTVPGSALTSCSISLRMWWWWLTPWLTASDSDSLCDGVGAGAVCSKVVVHGRRALAQRSQASPVASSRWHRSLKLRQRSQAKRREGRKFRLLAPGRGIMAASDCNRPLERRTCILYLALQAGADIGATVGDGMPWMCKCRRWHVPSRPGSIGCGGDAAAMALETLKRTPTPLKPAEVGFEVGPSYGRRPLASLAHPVTAPLLKPKSPSPAKHAIEHAHSSWHFAISFSLAGHSGVRLLHRPIALSLH